MSQAKCVQRYIAAHYDRIEVRVPKGARDEYRAYAESKGMSLTAWIRHLMDTEMRKRASEKKSVKSQQTVIK